jgi:antitoxin VapB
VRIPCEFALPGKEEIILKEDRRLIIEPARRQSPLAVLASLSTLEEDFPSMDDFPAEPANL